MIRPNHLEEAEDEEEVAQAEAEEVLAKGSEFEDSTQARRLEDLAKHTNKKSAAATQRHIQEYCDFYENYRNERGLRRQPYPITAGKAAKFLAVFADRPQRMRKGGQRVDQVDTSLGLEAKQAVSGQRTR